MQRDERANGRCPPRDYGGRSGGGYRPAPASADYSAAAQQRSRQRRRHRKHMLIVFYLLLFLAVLGTAAALSLTVLFKINDVYVTGTSRYSEQQILDASGIKTGDNLFLVKTKEASQKIRQTLPYLGTAEVSRKFPAQVQINVQEASVLGAAAYGTGYAMIGEDGMVLERVSVLPKSCTVLKGLNIKKAQPGSQVELADSGQDSLFKSTMSAVKKDKIDKITAADFSQPARVLLVYDGRVTINLGLPTDLDYKLNFARSLLQNNIKSTEKGTLNMSTVSDTNKAYFDPDYGVSSSGAAKK